MLKGDLRGTCSKSPLPRFLFNLQTPSLVILNCNPPPGSDFKSKKYFIPISELLKIILI